MKGYFSLPLATIPILCIGIACPCLSDDRVDDERAPEESSSAEPPDASRAADQEPVDQVFNQMVFGLPGTDGYQSARNRIRSLLAQRIESLGVKYDLSERDKLRLSLAGQGDIHRFFERIEAVRDGYRKALNGNRNLADLRKLDGATRAGWDALRDDPFESGSLLEKVLHSLVPSAGSIAEDKSANVARAKLRETKPILLKCKRIEIDLNLAVVKQAELDSMLGCPETASSNASSDAGTLVKAFVSSRERVRVACDESKWPKKALLVSDWNGRTVIGQYCRCEYTGVQTVARLTTELDFVINPRTLVNGNPLIDVTLQFGCRGPLKIVGVVDGMPQFAGDDFIPAVIPLKYSVPVGQGEALVITGINPWYIDRMPPDSEKGQDGQPAAFVRRPGSFVFVIYPELP
jgi:hypothetical protein